MKRFIAFVFVVMLVMSIAVTAYATPVLKIPEFKIEFKLPDSIFDKWFEDHPIELPEDFTVPIPEKIELSAPVITMAKYVHKAGFFGIGKRLEIRWGEVENAEIYIVQIVKYDGEISERTVSESFVYDTRAVCQKMFDEDSSEWVSAKVRVKAVCSDIESEWSEYVDIGCDMIH